MRGTMPISTAVLVLVNFRPILVHANGPSCLFIYITPITHAITHGTIICNISICHCHCCKFKFISHLSVHPGGKSSLPWSWGSCCSRVRCEPLFHRSLDAIFAFLRSGDIRNYIHTEITIPAVYVCLATYMYRPSFYVHLAGWRLAYSDHSVALPLAFHSAASCFSSSASSSASAALCFSASAARFSSSFLLSSSLNTSPLLSRRSAFILFFCDKRVYQRQQQIKH